ncbi:MAG: rod shape-determining protein MreC [Rhabdochlamydiaceae bacterium]
MKKSYKTFFPLIFFLFIILNLDNHKTNTYRKNSIKAVSTTWSRINTLKSSLSPPNIPKTDHHLVDEEFFQLKQENLALKQQIKDMKEWLLFDQRIEDQLDRLRQIKTSQINDFLWRDFFQRRSSELSHKIELQLKSLPAKVIFKEPISWNRSVWINVGQKDNQQLGMDIVSHNSPVLVGTFVLGLIEEVYETQSKVRLITDPLLAISVRASRGFEQNEMLISKIEDFKEIMLMRDDLFEQKTQKEICLAYLKQLQDLLKRKLDNKFLAKGQMRGSKGLFNRAREQTLIGVGFNDDFEEEEAPGLSLSKRDSNKLSLKNKTIQIGDLLTTTGLDGLFPQGLDVGIVSNVFPLKEGFCTYEIEAKLAIGHLDDISHCLVLPPIGYDALLDAKYKKRSTRK